MLHDVVASQLWPGDEPITGQEHRDERLLGSAVARPFQTAFGQDIHRSVSEKAAALFHSLIANHPFLNGNKRTAVLALEHFLLVNGSFLALSNREMYTLAKETATYRQRGMSQEAVLRNIVRTLEEATIPLWKLETEPEFSGLYRHLMKLARGIRKHKLNKAQPG
ncbi:type II toxin-antitoxin system death-on-curing family toxin [Acidobacteriia bacterium AH_259_A11_L15]|nr:type II toxin-antitoxin system death-on-curing family toxin [Acidobacteriia bacterium AH_259_A11_L15]